jgi:hypothetical protein
MESSPAGRGAIATTARTAAFIRPARRDAGDTSAAIVVVVCFVGVAPDLKVDANERRELGRRLLILGGRDFVVSVRRRAPATTWCDFETLLFFSCRGLLDMSSAVTEKLSSCDSSSHSL